MCVFMILEKEFIFIVLGRHGVTAYYLIQGRVVISFLVKKINKKDKKKKKTFG